MTSVIGQILPLAVAVALSAVPIMAAILILLSPARPRVSLALLVGWAAGVGIVVGLFTVGFGFTSSTLRPGDDPFAGIIRILLGTALIVYAVNRFLRRLGDEQTHETPKWMRAVERTNAPGALGFGFALALRPKNLILSIAAAAIIGEASLGVADGVVVIVLFTVIGVSTVAAPIVAHLAAPERTEDSLNSIRDWIMKNNAPMLLVVIIMTGAVIIGSGISKL